MMKQFLDFLEDIPVIDGHEHLLQPHERVKEETGFFDLLHYINADILSSGLTKEPPKTFKEFLVYYEQIKNTGYGKMIQIFAKDLYGVSELNEKSLEVLNKKIKMNSASVEAAHLWFDSVFEKAHIKAALGVDGRPSCHSVIKPVAYLDFFMRRSQIDFFKKQNKDSGNNFEDYIEYVRQGLEQRLENGIVAGKFGTPYWRSLDIEDFDLEKAKEEYNGEGEENPNFESYVFNYMLSFFEKVKMPVQFHTGHVEPSAANMEKYQLNWSNPSCFARFSRMYPDLKLVLLHTGFPYQNEYLSLIKNYPNLYADFSWVYLISPSLGADILKKAVEMIPINKIIGFGGDCIHVEPAYAHLQIAKRSIALAFSDLVAFGLMEEADAREGMRKILYDNPKELYSL